MYSLCRSWLSRPDMHPVAGVSSGVLPGVLPPPDVVVAVEQGPQGHHHQFAAHRAVLAANSGYFKSALDREPGTLCVTLSGVTPEAMAPLLNYMYTGRLYVGMDNIYNVLLAAYYLHMQRAIEWCQNFLLAHQPSGLESQGGGGGTSISPSSRSTVVKPIAGLPWRPALSAGPPLPPQPPAAHMVLPTAEHSPFRAPFLAPLPTALPAPSQPPEQRSPSPTASPRPSPRPSPKPSPSLDVVGAANAEVRDRPTAPHDDVVLKATATPTSPVHAKPAVEEPTTATSPSRPTTSAPNPGTTATTTSPSYGTTSVAGKVVLDVACCDGPVRFERVLNERYGREHADEDNAAPPDENQLLQGMNVPGAAQLRRARANRLAEGGAETSADTASSASEYRCMYCNHTFKSQFCYQKHARRHLNPLTPKLGGSQAEAQRPPAATRAPARPLDMNVQYYPCKTCGDKFPSYYFVHKHRKLYHSGEEGDASKSSDD